MRDDLYGIMRPHEVKEVIQKHLDTTLAFKLENWAHNELVKSMGDLRRTIEASEYNTIPIHWLVQNSLSLREFNAMCACLAKWGWDATMYTVFIPTDPTDNDYSIVLNLENL